jgi:hypothetical protein
MKYKLYVLCSQKKKEIIICILSMMLRLYIYLLIPVDASSLVPCFSICCMHDETCRSLTAVAKCKICM